MFYKVLQISGFADNIDVDAQPISTEKRYYLREKKKSIIQIRRQELIRQNHNLHMVLARLSRKHQHVQEPRMSFELEWSKDNHFGNENWAILWILEGVILLLRTLRERACLMHFEFKFLNDVLINFYAPLENKYDVFTPMDKVDRLPFNDVEALMGNITTKIATNCFLEAW